MERVIIPHRRPMRVYYAVLFVVLVLPLASVQATSTWNGGLRVATEGFSLDSTDPHGWFETALATAPIDAIPLKPVFAAGFAFQPFSGTGSVHVNLSMELLLATFQDHPWDAWFLRDTALVPAISVRLGWKFPDLYPSLATVMLQPLRFWFGEQTIGLLGIQYARDLVHSQDGWALRLFEITRYLW